VLLKYEKERERERERERESLELGDGRKRKVTDICSMTKLLQKPRSYR
jgi:hypothetical protein